MLLSDIFDVSPEDDGVIPNVRADLGLPARPPIEHQDPNARLGNEATVLHEVPDRVVVFLDHRARVLLEEILCETGRVPAFRCFGGGRNHEGKRKKNAGDSSLHFDLLRNRAQKHADRSFQEATD